MRLSKLDITVRGYHLDLYKHVNNSRYLEFLEEGRWDYGADKIGNGFLEDRNLGLVIVNNNINYRYPATLHDILEIKTWIDNVGSRSYTYKQEIYLKGTDTIVLDASVVVVVVDWEQNKAVYIDDELRDFLLN
jgi:thioesterase-3